MVKEKQSPIRDKPLRQAGQSLREEINDLIEDRIQQYLLLALFFVLLAGMEWYSWLTEMPRMPVLYTIVAIFFIFLAVYKFVTTLRIIRPMKLGLDGERVVGEFLELFREDGARVFHDLIGDNFNVDHVLICEQGVFVVETKTYSKPKDGRVVFDGKKILIDGYDSEAKLLIQARAEASWVKKILKDSTGKNVNVQPIIVFPGWFVETTAEGKKSDVTVLNPRLLKQHVGFMKSVLSKEDLMLIAYHLSRHIRMN